MFGNLLEGKKGLIMGVANNKSIAWGIAEICNKAGAKLAFTYQSDALLKRLEPLANSIGSNILIECDVSDHNSVTKTFKKLKYLSLTEHLAITDAFKANLSRGKLISNSFIFLR